MKKSLAPDVLLQARMSSSRLPKKVLAEINGAPMIVWQIERIKKCLEIGNLIVLTSSLKADDALFDVVTNLGVPCFRGEPEDVFQRYVDCVQEFDVGESFIRLTADCPLVMPNLLSKMIEIFSSTLQDYVSNTIVPTYPDGLDVEVVRTAAFITLNDFNLSKQEREHVTLGIRNREKIFKLKNVVNEVDLRDRRWTVDYKEDLDFVREVYAEFKNRELEFNLQDVLKFESDYPDKVNKRNASFRDIALKIGGENAK